MKKWEPLALLLLPVLSFSPGLVGSPDVVVEFTKMNGAGNDFVVIDNRAGHLRLTPPQVARLCHRHLGIGADGLLVLVPSRTGQAHWAWDFYNSDGSTAEMCGNAARCFTRFVERLTSHQGPLTFETGAGLVSAVSTPTGVTVSLTRPTSLQLARQVPCSDQTLTIHSLNTGVPHAVLFVPDADQAMVQDLGARIRFHSAFAPRGTNVNFVQVLAPGSIRVRTYERGVEGETLACGTGVTASALVSALVHDFTSPVQVRVQSGDTLEVRFQANGTEFSQVQLTGPAEFVFDGKVEV